LLGQILGQFDDSRENLVARIQVAKSLLSGQRYNPGAELFQDVNMLLKVRNALVHPRPQKIHGSPNSKDFGTQYPNFINHLQNKGLIASVKDGPAQSWYSLIETPKIAKWAYETSCSIIEDLINSFPDSTLKQMLEMMRPHVTALSEEPQSKAKIQT
jgi:hypothetical protein